MVTEDGHPKIIDFGLAKLFEPVSESEGETIVTREDGKSTTAPTSSASG